MNRLTEIIPGDGPMPCDILLCGERPGREEYYKGRPFVGKSGRELDRYLLNDVGVDRSRVYATNLVKDFHPDNDDPTPAEVERDRPLLIEELKKVRPKFIGAVGRFAAAELIGPDFNGMETDHGLPFRTAHRAVMPLYHPSYGLHSPHVTPLVWSDFVAFGKLVRGEEIERPMDQYPDAEYRLLTNSLPHIFVNDPIYIDTEGSVERPWGLSFTQVPGTGWVIQAKNTALLKRFAAVIKKLDLLVVCHNVQHDFGVLRAMGIEEFRYSDTQIKAYNNTLVPQGLKALGRRLCGVVQEDYEDVVREAQANKTLDWLMEAWSWANNRYPEESKTHSRPKTPKTDTNRSKKTSRLSV